MCVLALLVAMVSHPRLSWHGILLLMLGLCLPNSLTAAPMESTPIGHFTQTTYEQQYKAAKEHLVQLEQNPAIGNDRSNWLTGVRAFRRIHAAQRGDSSLGPTSLYMVGKVYRQMFDRFHLPLDRDNAIETLLDVAEQYPANALADDALLLAADSMGLDPNRLEEAESLYGKIIEVYPKGDQINSARFRLDAIKTKARAALPAASPPLPAPLTKPELTTGLSSAPVQADAPISGSLAQIAPVKYWSSDSYTRIVIQSSTPVSFNATLLDKSNDQPRRLFIDFRGSQLSPQARTPVLIQDGLLKQARSGQYSSDTVRVVLDIESLSDYKVFSLNDPFRVIVDVHGVKVNASPTANQPLVTEQGRSSVPISPPKVTQKPSYSAPPGTMQEEAPITLSDKKKWKTIQDPSRSQQHKGVSDSKISLAQQLGLGVRKIVIDPGHGGKDPGAMAFGLKEKDIVLKIARKVEVVLKNKYNYQVSLTRTKDSFLPLEERTAIANTRGADLFLSIHVNAHPDKTIGGIETYFLNLATNADAMRVAALENATSTHSISELQSILSDLMNNSKIEESSRLAQFVQANLVNGARKSYQTKDLGVKQAPFYVLIGAEMPAILAEISFITNPEEARLLQDDNYLQRIAEQIAAGIAAYVDHHHTAALGFFPSR